jgi:AcrR family transcriptional regulator
MASVTKSKKSASVKTATSAGYAGTPQRIVLRSIELFNRHGIQNVAIDRIASDLKISPGNLTYHFKRKDDLIRATLDILKERLRVALQRPVAVSSAQDGAEYLIQVFRTFWDFRFFFNSLAYLLTDDRQLRKEYAQFNQWALDIMVADVEFLVELGHFRAPVEPNNFRLLSENIWGQLLHWLRLQQIESPSASTPPNAAIYDAALHLWSLCHLWMKPAFATELLRAFQALLIPERLAKTVAIRTPRKDR